MRTSIFGRFLSNNAGALTLLVMLSWVASRATASAQQPTGPGAGRPQARAASQNPKAAQAVSSPRAAQEQQPTVPSQAASSPTPSASQSVDTKPQNNQPASSAANCSKAPAPDPDSKHVFWYVFYLITALLVLMFLGITISLVRGNWSVSDALSEESSVQPTPGKVTKLPSTSRFIALFGLLGILTIVLGVGYTIIWSLFLYQKPPDNLSQVRNFLYGAACLFAPYLANQLRAAFDSSPEQKGGNGGGGNGGGANAANANAANPNAGNAANAPNANPANPANVNSANANPANPNPIPNPVNPNPTVNPANPNPNPNANAANPNPNPNTANPNPGGP